MRGRGGGLGSDKPMAVSLDYQSRTEAFAQRRRKALRILALIAIAFAGIALLCVMWDVIVMSLYAWDVLDSRGL